MNHIRNIFKSYWHSKPLSLLEMGWCEANILLALLFAIISFPTRAQQQTPPSDSTTVNKRFPTYTGPRHMLYAEVLGSAGGLFSLNYENVIRERKKSLISIKVGISISPYKSSIFSVVFGNRTNFGLYIPLIIEKNYARKKKYGFVEYGWGISPYYHAFMGTTIDQYYNCRYDRDTTIWSTRQLTFIGIMLSGKIGFRFQPVDSDWFTRIGIQGNINLASFGGANGYRFSRYYENDGALLSPNGVRFYIPYDFLLPTIYFSIGKTF